MYRPSRDFPRVAVCAQGHPFVRNGTATLAELSRPPLFFPGSRSITRLLVEGALARAGLLSRAGPEAGGWEAIKIDATAGFCVAVVPDLCLTDQDRRRIAVRSTGTLFDEDCYGGVVRRGSPHTLAAREIIRRLDPGFPLGKGDAF